MLALGFKLTNDKDNADDLIQDVTLQILRKADSYTEEGSFMGWASTIIRNTFINSYRKTKKRRDSLGTTVELMDYMEVDGDENVFEPSIKQKIGIDSDLMNAVNELDGDSRNIILLSSEGYDYEDISAIMDIPVGTVRSRLFRVRKTLKEKLKHEHR